MKPIRRILVAVKDTSAKTSPAIEKAIQIARVSKASVELYHAITEPIYADFELTDMSLRQLRQQRMETHLGRLQTIATHFYGTGVRIASHADWDYPVYEAIVRRAAAVRADLIVAECHAGRRLAPWVLHLTDWELLRTSPVPVLLVKTKEPYEKPIVLAAIDPSHLHAKPAKLDDAILKTARGITQHLSGSLHAMHAYFPVPLDVPVREILTDAQTERLYTRVEARARERFERTAKNARLPRAMRHLVSENPVVAIPRVAQAIGANLVVMGAVSRSGLKRVFIGNTAERVLAALRCDVLVVKPNRFAMHVARKVRGARFVPPHFPSLF